MLALVVGRWYAEDHGAASDRELCFPTGLSLDQEMNDRDRVRHLIAPPIVDGDEEQAYAARLLNTALLAILLGVLLYNLVTPLIMPFALHRVVISGAIVGLLLAMMFLLRRAYLRGQLRHYRGHPGCC